MNKGFLKLRDSHDDKYQNMLGDAGTEPHIRVRWFNIAITAMA
jgi:hypothetical protein